MARGFILQPTYRVERGKAVVRLYGRLASGASFVVRHRAQRPKFWIAEHHATTATGLGARVEADPGRATLAGVPVVAIVTDVPQDVPAMRQALTSRGVPTFEADVRFAYRYLVDRGLRGDVEIDGVSRDGRDHGTDVAFDDPEVTAADAVPGFPVPRVLSIDIETDPRASRVLSIALHGCGAAEVLLVAHEGARLPEAAVGFADEGAMLRAFAERVRALDPDVLTGWNVIDFDLSVLARAAERTGVRLALGRDAEPLRVRGAARGAPRGHGVTLSGRLVLDGIDLVRGAFLKFESYALNAVAREVVGRGKTLSGPDRVEDILHAYRHDVPGFVEYNLEDARLVTEILERLDLVPLAIERSRLTGMPLDRVSAAIASFDSLYLAELAKAKIVAPSVGSVETARLEQSGGHVLDPKVGLHERVLALDFKSLYPSLIRTFQIDPLGHARAGAETDPIVAPDGTRFRRRPGILPGVLDAIAPIRDAAKRVGDTVRANAIKILMNSCYGVLGTSACRFHHPELANAITGFGKHVLLWTRDRIESLGHEVLYGDTDSLFVRSGADDTASARERGVAIAERVNRDLAAYVRERWRVDSRLELEFERLYVKILLPEARHGTGGARKRYAGLVEEPDGSTVVTFTGLEVVRRDWTALARDVQRELYERLFRGRAVEAYLADVVSRVRAGRHDDRLVYRKALRKALSEYTDSNPPHVVAARRARRPPGRTVRYVVTAEGPYVADEPHPALDHEHYVQRQIRPVALPVLTVLGLDFDRAIGDDRQLRLF